MAADSAPGSEMPASNGAAGKLRAVSPFRFPPSLSPRHEEELRKRAISREFALASGVRTGADNELRDLNFQASLPHEERSKGLSHDMGNRPFFSKQLLRLCSPFSLYFCR